MVDPAHIFAAMGTPEAPEAIRRAVEAGPTFAEALLAAWRTPWPESPEADPRDAHHDAMTLAHALAQRSPSVMLAACEADSELAAMLVAAVGTLDDARADALLLPQLASPLWSQRMLALRAMARRARLRAGPRGATVNALEDADTSVVCAAIESLQKHGEPEDISALARIAAGAEGFRRRRAEEAIEAIRSRAAARAEDSTGGGTTA